MANLSIEKCSWVTDFSCRLLSLFKDENQYITWFLVLIGWLIALLIAIWQTNRNRKESIKNTQNEWIGEFREKLTILEDEALLFWAGNSNQEKAIGLQKLIRNIKALTTIAREIDCAGGVKYNSILFKDLRQSITIDSDLESRPLSPTCFRIIKIRETCAGLRRFYSRSIFAD